MKKIKIANISKVVTVVSGLLIFASCKKSDKQVIKKKKQYFADVKERFDRKLIKLPFLYYFSIKRANRAFPVIEPILKKMEFQMILNI
jgi:hypothetical protein